MLEYSMDTYLKELDKNGLKKTWHSILFQLLNNKINSDLFVPENFGELYEIGLEHVNKISKKEMGKYYTPKDVAEIMAKWLIPLDGENICDVGCGVGNLILTYLEQLDFCDAYNLISSGRIYLYDIDEIALEICKFSIAIKYGKELKDKIHTRHCDFLDKKVKLPKNSKVISNPPYYKITKYGENWNITPVVSESRELYSSFMEKIIKQSNTSVVITPYSFIGSDKYYSLRRQMNNYNGFIVSFDNVPGNIFNGRKHGIFNSNKGNSVRAAITVVENNEGFKGFKISPLIRFKTEERKKMLNNNLLFNLVGNKYQIVDDKQKAYYKCHKELSTILKKWEAISNQRLGNIINGKDGLQINFPTTCRYFTVGSKKSLKRDGKRIIYVNNKEKYNYVYCMLNSTFAYWYWRLLDGGINCPLSIINNIPIFYDKLTTTQKNQINKIAEKMQNEEVKYLVYKKNAGKNQENIKFPVKYRNEINKIFLEALGINKKAEVFKIVHSSSLFDESDGDKNEY